MTSSILGLLDLRVAASRSLPGLHPHCGSLRSFSSIAATQDDAPIYDVVIVGSGMVGSAFAALLGRNSLTRSLKVAILDHQPQSLEPTLSEHPELRVSTITARNIEVLREAGAWEDVQRHAAMFSHMQVWDAFGSGCIRWHASELGQPHMGCVVENSVLQAALLSASQNAAPPDGVQPTLVWPASVTSLGLPGHAAAAAPPPPPPPPSPPPAPPASVRPPSQAEPGCGSHEGAGQGPRDGLAWVGLADGRHLKARLVVAADGANSRVRDLAGLRTSGTDYGQRALVATVETSQPDDRTAWQRFLPSGPFALLPVRAGHHNIVWTTTPSAARALEAMPPLEFAAAANRALHSPVAASADRGAQRSADGGGDGGSSSRSSAGLGQAPPGTVGTWPFTAAAAAASLARSLDGLATEPHRWQAPPNVLRWVGSSPKSFPLRLKTAGRYVQPRLALIGDAAHAVHPLAGQGVNLGLADAHALAQALAAARECGADIGDAMLLEENYEAPRKAANTVMIAALDGIKSAFATQSPPLAQLRTVGLGLINAAGPVRNSIMRYAMGV